LRRGRTAAHRIARSKEGFTMGSKDIRKEVKKPKKKKNETTKAKPSIVSIVPVVEEKK
jgi:hypothetical protein